MERRLGDDYDQSCATERRRLRKRGKVAPATERVYIDPEICEGCGDCGLQSNCIAIEPHETALGRKRRINQSICNQDYSCLKGFCPSFVTIKGGKPRAVSAVGGLDTAVADAIEEATPPEIGDGYDIPGDRHRWQRCRDRRRDSWHGGAHRRPFVQRSRHVRICAAQWIGDESRALRTDQDACARRASLRVRPTSFSAAIRSWRRLRTRSP
jgi:hypothetical protein